MNSKFDAHSKVSGQLYISKMITYKGCHLKLLKKQLKSVFFILGTPHEAPIITAILLLASMLLFTIKHQ
jgi:hypothetical protein